MPDLSLCDLKYVTILSLKSKPTSQLQPLICLTPLSYLNLVPRASVAFPQKVSRPADTPGKRRPDLDKFCLAQTDVLRPLMLARNHRAGTVQ